MACSRCRCSRATSVEICVVDNELWPRSNCSARRSAPRFSRCVAKLWRNPCGLMRRGSMPATAAYCFTSFQKCWRLGDSPESKQRLNNAIAQITPVRNEIAHVREVSPDRLQRAHVACGEVLAMIGRA